MATTPQSRKSKGRRLQQLTCAALYEIGKVHGLQKDDIKSTSMGVSGVDVQLSPAAKGVFGHLAVECKNCEKLNVVGVFTQHSCKYPNAVPILVHKRNHTEPMVTLRMIDYMDLLSRSLNNNGLTN